MSREIAVLRFGILGLSLVLTLVAVACATGASDDGGAADSGARTDTGMDSRQGDDSSIDAAGDTSGDDGSSLGDTPIDTGPDSLDAGADGAGDVVVVGSCGDASFPILDAGGAPSQLIVFASSQVLTGDMGGLVGADCVCQGLAYAQGLPGVFKAWLSDSTTSAASRLTHGTVPYKLVDGTLVASDWTALTSGTLAHAIDKTETNVTPPAGSTFCGSPTVWTDTTANGSLNLAISTCTDWTSSAGSNAAFGYSQNTDAGWTSGCYSSGAPPPCANTSPVYCLQQ